MVAAADLEQAFRTPLTLNAKSGETVLVITDDAMDPALAQGLAGAARDLGMHPVIVTMPARETHSSDPVPSVVAAAMDPSVDLAVYLTSTAMAHAPFNEHMLDAGKRFILMEELTAAMLAPGGPAFADYHAIDALGQKIARRFSDGAAIRVTCPNGTDLTARIDGRVGRSIAGLPLVMRPSGGGGCAFPDGEAHVCPVEGTGEGRIVFDLTAHSIGTLDEPLVLEVEKGMVREVSGGRGAKTWNRILTRLNDPACYNCPAEIAVGLNPMVTPLGVMRTDKKMYGTAHIGMGDTLALGGTCKAAIRLEGVISRPTVVVDGMTIAADGTLYPDGREASEG